MGIQCANHIVNSFPLNKILFSFFVPNEEEISTGFLMPYYSVRGQKTFFRGCGGPEQVVTVGGGKTNS